MAAPVTLRPATPADEPFLFRVYASTREEELAPVPWTTEQKRAFLAQQFRAQSAYYREQYPAAAFDVILADGVPAGRLYVNRAAEEIRLIDIALLPEHRGAGVGGALLRELQDEARATRRRLTIHVEKMNPARRLYDRLGFRAVEDKGVYDFLEWRPEEPVS